MIAEVLGHDNLDVTAHYAQASTRLMMEACNSPPYAKIPKKPQQTESLRKAIIEGA